MSVKEIWNDISGYENVYAISTNGRIKRLERTISNSGTIGGYCTLKEKILKPRVNKKRHGYCEISLKLNKQEKRFKVHRLVALTFIPNPFNLPEVNHIDGNKENNTINNLEWCTSKENKKHGWENGLYNSEHRKVPIKCNENGICYESVVNASKEIPCDRRGIFRVLKGEKERIKGLSFSYITHRELEEYRSKELELYRGDLL